ncbi:MAG TPA: condensation domain-containing protein, partial [Pyrinomonadaceae bacterium]
MTIDEFVSHMRSLDVKLWAEDGRLRYSAPQGVLTEELLGQLAARKQEVIAFLRSSEQSPGTNGQPLAPAPRDGELPLSFAQERLWLFDQLGLNRSVYNITVGYRVEGRLDVSALRRCLEEIVRRHEALRTVFDSQGGRAVQVILPELRPSFAEVDLSADPEGRGGARFRQLAAAEAERPFDLTRGPLLRATLVRTGGQEHVLLLTMHHIVSDGWSMGIFERELVTLYECYSTGKPSPLKELPVQYADFAVWERRRLAVGQLEGQLSYWKERLGGDLPVLDLPTDHTRPAVQLFEGANYSFDIPKSLTEDLKSLGREQGATLFMTLLAGWQALLSRYSNQQDICVGTPIAGRTRVETEGLIGFFVNTLVLRTDLSGEPSFRELLGRVREVCLGAFAHQDVPFEKLVEEVARERSLSRTPLFQVMFALQNTPREARLAGGLVLQPQSFATGRAKFDLTLVAHESDGGLRVTLNYRTDLFDAETIGRMAGHYERLLEAAARNPDEAVSRAELLDAKERRQLVVGWSHTRLGQMP